MAAQAMLLHLLFLFSFSYSASSHAKMGSPISAISAAPAFLPEAPASLLSPHPSYSPALSPDGSMLPEFPTPRAGVSPATSIITSVQSPPNPDTMVPPEADDDDGFLTLAPVGYSASIAADTSSSSPRSAVVELVVVFLLFKSSLILLLNLSSC